MPPEVEAALNVTQVSGHNVSGTPLVTMLTKGVTGDAMFIALVLVMEVHELETV